MVTNYILLIGLTTQVIYFYPYPVQYVFGLFVIQLLSERSQALQPEICFLFARTKHLLLSHGSIRNISVGLDLLP